MNETIRAGSTELVRPADVGARAIEPALALTGIDDIDVLPSTRSEGPAWQRDVLSISSRVRAILATIKPLVVRAFGFWDHHVRELVLGARTMRVDSAGSYRF